MYTKEELMEIRARAEQEVGGTESNFLWRDACTLLASSADRLLSLTDRICRGEITALADKSGKVKLRQASEE
jgi:hypothetical protein